MPHMLACQQPQDLCKGNARKQCAATLQCSALCVSHKPIGHMPSGLGVRPVSGSKRGWAVTASPPSRYSPPHFRGPIPSVLKAVSVPQRRRCQHKLQSSRQELWVASQYKVSSRSPCSSQSAKSVQRGQGVHKSCPSETALHRMIPLYCDERQSARSSKSKGLAAESTAARAWTE